MAPLIIAGLIRLLGVLGADLVIGRPALLVRHLPGDGHTLGLIGSVTLLVVLGVVLGDIVLVALLVVGGAALLSVDSLVRGLTMSTMTRGVGLGLGVGGGKGQDGEKQSRGGKEL